MSSEPPVAASPPEGDRAQEAQPTGSGLWRQLFSGAPKRLSEGSGGVAVALVALPMMASMGIDIFHAILELGFVSRLGSNAVAALGLNESLMIAVFMVGDGLGTAAMAIVARRIGEGRREQAGAVCLPLLGAAAAVGIPVGLGLAALAPVLLRGLGADPSVVAQGTPFARIMLGACAIPICQATVFGMLQAAGASTRAVGAQLISFALNVALCPLLLFGWGPVPSLGLPGVGIAFACARSAALIYMLWLLFSGRAGLPVRVVGPRTWQPGELGAMARLAGGAAAQQLVVNVTNVPLLPLIAPFGMAMLAGYTVTMRITGLLFLPAVAFAQGVSVVVGQSLGARDPARAERVALRTGLALAGYASAVAAVLLLGVDVLLRPLVSDPDAAFQAARYLRIGALAFIPASVGTVLLFALNGAGDTVRPAVLHLVFLGAVQLALAWALSHTGLADRGVLVAMAVAQTLNGLGNALLFRGGRWKTLAV